jgi:hypothetical protein
MIQELKEYYRGVLCLCCRQPIPLPAIITRMEITSASSAGEEGDRVFTLRCRACEREMPYRASNVVEIKGTPRSRVSRGADDRARLLRQQNRMSRAANG